MIEISLEEFSNEVKKEFKKRNTYLTDDEIEKYFKSEEGKNEILYAYESDEKKYKSGEYSYNEFMIGTVSAVANCLTYMYE